MLALVGAVMGSFLGLVSLRLPAGGPIVFGRSHCSGCSRALGAADLVPLLSYAALRGRCRTCGAAIDKRYPLVEAASALIGAVSAFAFPDVQAIAAAILGWWLLLLALLDGEHYWLPDKLTYPLIAAGLISAGWFGVPSLLDAAIGAAVGFLVLATLAALYRKLRGRHGLGGGDAKLFAAAGSWLGWQDLPLVLLGAATSALVAALILHRKQPDFMAQRLPFGVFLAPAIWLLYLIGPIG